MRHPELIAEVCQQAGIALRNSQLENAILLLRLLHTLLNENKNTHDNCEMRVIGFLSYARMRLETKPTPENQYSLRQKLSSLCDIARGIVQSNKNIDEILHELENTD